MLLGSQRGPHICRGHPVETDLLNLLSLERGTRKGENEPNHALPIKQPFWTLCSYNNAPALAAVVHQPDFLDMVRGIKGKKVGFLRKIK